LAPVRIIVVLGEEWLVSADGLLVLGDCDRRARPKLRLEFFPQEQFVELK
jgi:hypothetical protein